MYKNLTKYNKYCTNEIHFASTKKSRPETVKFISNKTVNKIYTDKNEAAWAQVLYARNRFLDLDHIRTFHDDTTILFACKYDQDKVKRMLGTNDYITDKVPILRDLQTVNKKQKTSTYAPIVFASYNASNDIQFIKDIAEPLNNLLNTSSDVNLVNKHRINKFLSYVQFWAHLLVDQFLDIS